MGVHVALKGYVGRLNNLNGPVPTKCIFLLRVPKFYLRVVDKGLQARRKVSEILVQKWRWCCDS